MNHSSIIIQLVSIVVSMWMSKCNFHFDACSMHLFDDILLYIVHNGTVVWTSDESTCSVLICLTWEISNLLTTSSIKQSLDNQNELKWHKIQNWWKHTQNQHGIDHPSITYVYLKLKKNNLVFFRKIFIKT